MQSQQMAPMAGLTRPSLIAARRRVLAFALLAAGGLAVLYFINPAGSSVLPRCPSFVLSDYHCPGCGSLRATHALLHGRVTAAIGHNVLYIACLPFVVAGLLLQGVQAFRGQPAPALATRVRPVWLYALAGLVLSYWIARNLPWWPFTWLAPG
jgi:hypothetical protein